MTKERWNLTQEVFDQLLAWLDSNREQAGRRYESIRNGLIHMFRCRGCNDAEDLADETMNRVARKIVVMTETYVGEPAAYFFAVAKLVHKEYLRRRPVSPPPVQALNTSELEKKYQCLENCMQRLSPEERELILQYYQEEKRTKINNRQQLAEKLGIMQNALRIRICRMRAKLSECVLTCFQREMQADIKNNRTHI